MNFGSKNIYVCESEICSFGTDGSCSIMHIVEICYISTQLCTLLNKATVSVVAVTET